MPSDAPFAERICKYGEFKFQIQTFTRELLKSDIPKILLQHNPMTETGSIEYDNVKLINVEFQPKCQIHGDRGRGI